MTPDPDGLGYLVAYVALAILGVSILAALLFIGL